MNSMDSTLEALPLHYIGFGLSSVVNNIWTLVALVTAAFSFWRLKGTALLLQLPDHRRVGSSPERESASEDVDSMPESSIREAAAVPVLSVVSETAAAPPVCGDGATKGKFVVYYREDEGRDVAAAETATTVEDEIGNWSAAGEWREEWDWEEVWRMRRKGGEGNTPFILKYQLWYDEKYFYHFCLNEREQNHNYRLKLKPFNRNCVIKSFQ